MTEDNEYKASEIDCATCFGEGWCWNATMREEQPCVDCEGLGSCPIGNGVALAEVMESLALADAALSGANMNMRVVERKVKAVLAKAIGQ